MHQGDIFSRNQIHLSYVYGTCHQVTGHAHWQSIKFVLAILVEGHPVTISAKLFLILICLFGGEDF